MDSTQAMVVCRARERQSRFSVRRGAADGYALSRSDADTIIRHTAEVINDQCGDDAADTARLAAAERQWLWHRQILNESVSY